MEIAFKIRYDLIVNFNFVRLVTILTPGHTGGGVFNPSVKASLKATEEFINHANEQMFIEGGPALLNALDPILKASTKNFPPKKSLSEISHAYSELIKNDSEIYSYGIPFKWIDTYIDTSRNLSPDIPYQARIGTGYHAGKWSLEEMYLLDDGFFFLINAEAELEYLHILKTKIEESENKGYPDEDFYFKARTININTCSYARNSIVNLYSFVECFVNSIGYDYYLRNKDILTTEEQDLLQGKRKGNFVSLEYKVEKFHQLIRPDHKQVLSTSDPKQIKEPFKTFFAEYKEIRDAAMHYSPNKKAIWIKPTDWTTKAKDNSELVIKVANQIWNACYPNKIPPFYLRDLDYQKCYDAAKTRLTETDDIRKRYDKKDSTNFRLTEAQYNQIDSILLYGDEIKKRSWLGSIEFRSRRYMLQRTKPLPKFYDRIKEIVDEGVYEALPLLAQYKNPSDTTIFKKLLLDDEFSNRGRTLRNYVRNSVRYFPSPAFYPILKEQLLAEIGTNGISDRYESFPLYIALVQYPTTDTRFLFQTALNKSGDEFDQRSKYINDALQKFPSKVFEDLIKKVQETNR